jgi:hypothetical protein
MDKKVHETSSQSGWTQWYTSATPSYAGKHNRRLWEMQKGHRIDRQTCRKLGPGVLGVVVSEMHNSLVASYLY